MPCVECHACHRQRSVDPMTVWRIATGRASGLCRSCSDAARARVDPLPRFLAKVEEDASGCWVWQAHVLPTGYGVFKLRGKMRGAHRVAYELLVGPIPTGLHLDHLCRNRRCVNPEHLEPVTCLENIRRGYWANVTHCPAGHPYSEENTYRSPRGGRFCRLCNAAAQRRYRTRKAAAA